MPLNKIGSINKINKTFSKLEQEFEREPSTEEIANAMEVSIDDIKDAMRTSGRHISMDAPLTQGEDSTLIDVLGDDDQPHPDATLITESLRREVERALSTLTTTRSRCYPSLFRSCLGEQPMTLEEIGERFDLTRERVRQIKEKAIRRLKHTSRSKILKTYLG